MLRLRLMPDARTLIARAGGLFSRAGLAKRWGVSQQYVGKVTRRVDFPTPIHIDDDPEQPRWFADEADAWRAAHRRS